MLRKDVIDLASRSLQAALVERHNAFPDQLRKINAELAAKGIARSGAAFKIISDAARKECELRMDIAATELQRAAASKGVRYRKDLGTNLGAALDEITQNLCGNVESTARSALQILPNAGSALGMFQSQLQMARAGRLAKGRTDLEHYAESLRSEDQQHSRKSRLKIWQGMLIAEVSSVVTILITWVAHLLKIF